nr:hypothetical protein [uncultured Chitinophaga sp.]
MPVINIEKYKDTPGYQQVYQYEANQLGCKWGLNTTITPTADRSLHTFMIKPGRADFILYPTAAPELLTVYLILGFFSFFFAIAAGPFLGAFAIAAAALLSWLLTIWIGKQSRKEKSVLVVNSQGINLRKGTYSWSSIKGSFIVVRQLNQKHRKTFLTIVLTNDQMVSQLLHSDSIIRDITSELATTIAYYKK